MFEYVYQKLNSIPDVEVFALEVPKGVTFEKAIIFYPLSSSYNFIGKQTEVQISIFAKTMLETASLVKEVVKIFANKRDTGQVLSTQVVSSQEFVLKDGDYYQGVVEIKVLSTKELE